MKYFDFKKYPQDFIVEEKLWENPSGKWYVFYVFFEKKNKNTFDIINFLCKKLNLKRKHFWIAGLKDKFWITRQRISIYKRTLNSRGGVDKFLEVLSKQVNILKVSWWDKLLKVWDNKGNLFFLRLRRKHTNIPDDTFKQAVEKVLENIKNNWFPNYFWKQRFWKKLTNPKIGKKLILWEKKIENQLEAQFKVQAYASWLFNKYLDLRIKNWFFDKIIKWDILVYRSDKKDIFKLVDKSNVSLPEKRIPTWAVYWYNLVVSWDFVEKDWIITKFEEITPALELELQILKEEWFSVNVLYNFKKFNVFWIRRTIKVFPDDLRYKWDKNWDLLLMFELPSWSYASVLVEQLDKNIWQILDKKI